MKYARLASIFFAAFVATAAFAQSNTQAAFDKIKSLEGSWAGKTSDGHDIQVDFRVVSADSAVMSEIHGAHEANMITMFHPDGDRLLMTHYCGTGNQPRMVGTLSPDGKTISFNFLDATNVLSSQPGHMQQLVLTVLDPNHHTEQWDFIGQDGKLHRHETFDLQRAK